MDPYLTMQGNLVADPAQTVVASGRKVTKFRIACNGRRFDSAGGEWINTDPVFMSVTCWNKLGDNVMRSLAKGDTVIVHGRLKFREYDSEHGRRQSYGIDAQSVGPDLTRYVAQLGRPLRELPPDVPVQAAPVDGRSADEPPFDDADRVDSGDTWADGGVGMREQSVA